MGLKVESWNIAFRLRKEKYIYDDIERPFRVIKNNYTGWFADPFLFDHNGETYLFVEFFRYKDNKGVIAYAKYDEKKKKFGKFKTIINEEYHLSYPLVINHNGNIYMLPEASESNSLYLYKAVAFPEKWEKLEPMITGEKLTDTTPVEINNKMYAFTYRIDGVTEDNGELLILHFEDDKVVFSQQGVISRDVSIARPGGKFIYDNGNLIRVSQDCSGGYGRAINFSVVTGDIDDHYFERLIKKIEPKDIKSNICQKHCGVHTYNVSDKIEVIDLKYNKFRFIRIFYKIINKIFR